VEDVMGARPWLLVGLLAALSVGCGGEEKAGTGTSDRLPAATESAGEAHENEAAEEVAEAGDEAREEAEKIFATRCFTCHGATGEGNGPGSAALTPKPRNFHEAQWQASVTDDHIAKIIQYGGAAVGKSPAMPGNPDLMSKPQVVQALVAHVRRLGAAQ
jgi:mono/diheme cytochrome c family protein